ncbi:surface-associated interspersed protein (SURFIN), partial [Plasmodium relictum]
MNTEKKINRRKNRSASQYGAGYDRWKNQVTSDFNSKLQNISTQRDNIKKRRLCREFNNNVDDTKEDFMGQQVDDLNVEGNPDDAWNEIEQHINTKISQYPNIQCNRIPSNYPKEIRDKRKKIIDFCEDRDTRFGIMKKKNEKDECLKYNQWIDEEKDTFISSNPWSISDSLGSDQAFKISQNCTLIKMGMFSNENCSKYNSKSKSKPSNLPGQQRSGSSLVATQQRTPSSTAMPIKTILPTTTLNITTIPTPAPIAAATSTSTTTPISTNATTTTTTTTAKTTSISTNAPATTTIPTSTPPSIPPNISAPTPKTIPPLTSTTTQTNTSTSTPTPSTIQATTPISTKVPLTTSANVSKVNVSSSPTTLKPTTTSTSTTAPTSIPSIIQATASITAKVPSNTTSVSKVNTSLSPSTTAPKTTPISTFTPSTTLSTTFHNESYGNISSGTPIKSSSTVTKSTIIQLSASLGPFLGILIFFIFVYRCTPIGSWLGNCRSKKKRTQKKKKQIQVDSESIFPGFSDKESEINMKNFPICNEKNSPTCEIALENENNERNIEAKSNIVERRKKWKWKAVIEVHMMVLEEFQKEEWELNRREFLKICLEEFKEEGIYSDVINRHLITEGDQKKIASIFLEQRPLWKIWIERNNKLIEKWKKEQWFKNLKKEWKKEVNKYITLIEKEEMMKNKKKGAINPMLEKQKIIWKKWIQKQNKLHTFDDEELLKQLLVEYETEEEMKKNMETIDREKIRIDIEKKDKAFKDSNKNELISRLRIEIHMMVLDECKKEEWIRNKKEFFKICIGELKLQDNSDEKELLEVEEEIMKSITLKKKKKEELEKFKKGKYFIELKQEWMNNEKKYIEEVNKENLL